MIFYCRCNLSPISAGGEGEGGRPAAEAHAEATARGGPARGRAVRATAAGMSERRRSAVEGEISEAAELVANLSLGKLISHIKDRSAEWSLRDAALQRMAQLISSDGIDPQGTEFKHLVAAIVEQLPDLRSQVARSACVTLSE